MQANAKAKILVVDDEPMNVHILKRLLERVGHEICTAYNGREALDAISENHFDLILLDIMMPQVDGFEVLDELQQQKSQIPVIMVSALNDYDTINKAHSMGACDFLTKPVKPATIYSAVEKQLNPK